MDRKDRCVEEDSKPRLLMNDNPELFHKNNGIPRSDAIDSLEEYSSKFKWKSNARVFDIGSADGSVTSIISRYIPDSYEILMGCDINENSVKFANTMYATDRMKFIVLDIETPIPDNLREYFDHVFSFYTLHWLNDPVEGYRNVYKLLKPGGECFLTVPGKSPFYDIFHALSQTNRWAPWIKDYDAFVSQYHDCKDPDNIIYESLKEIGFHTIDIRCKQKVYFFKSTEMLKSNVASINPFKIPTDLLDEFLEDYLDVARDMRLVENNNSVKFNYNVILIHCCK